jgi:hypothetical protein
LCSVSFAGIDHGITSPTRPAGTRLAKFLPIVRDEDRNTHVARNPSGFTVISARLVSPILTSASFWRGQDMLYSRPVIALHWKIVEGVSARPSRPPLRYPENSIIHVGYEIRQQKKTGLELRRAAHT